MTQEVFLEAVRERDVDLLLLEELRISEPFRAWFLDRVGLGGPHEVERHAVHSISAAGYGESDLVLVVRAAGGRCAILIEDKVDAEQQPEQDTRYQERGKKGQQDGEWETFRTVLVAPEDYLSCCEGKASYDRRVSFEDIADWFSKSVEDPLRCRYRADVLRLAIDKMRRGYQKHVDRPATDFFHLYCTLANDEFPGLRVKGIDKAGGKNEWIKFQPTGLDRTRFVVWHKMNEPAADLQFRKTSVDFATFESVVSDYLESPMIAARPRGRRHKAPTGTFFVRLPFPDAIRVDRHEAFGPQEDRARRCLKEIEALADWAREHQAAFSGLWSGPHQAGADP